MISKADAAVDALEAALVAAAIADPDLPEIWRNRSVLSELPEEGVAVNVVDGDERPISEDLGSEGDQEFYKVARIEIAAGGVDDRDRDQRFARAKAAIGAVLLANRVDKAAANDALPLGGACDDVEFDGVSREDTVFDNLPKYIGGEIEVRMLISAESMLT